MHYDSRYIMYCTFSAMALTFDYDLNPQDFSHLHFGFVIALNYDFVQF